ncbi:MAG: amidohydrolase family protein [Planctomycetota bacterium]|jgi:predicted TIM-barrel fold metal-dependent hydrolase
MIVDCHTHVWESVEQLGLGTVICGDANRIGGETDTLSADPNEHLSFAEPVDRTIVLAIKSHYIQAHVPNDYVAKYVNQHPGKLIGFAAVDPSHPAEAIEELRRAHDELGIQGVTVWPAAQDCHPVSTGAMRVYEETCRLGMPILFHQDVQASSICKMEFARPYLLDEVAREFADLKIAVSQLGLPWIDETIALLGKHKNVFADISGLLNYPWQAYNALVCAYQGGVMDRLLFGSNFPNGSAAECIEVLYSINQLCHGTNLPTIPREQLRQIVERDALNLLGIAAPETPPQPQSDTAVIRTEE